MYLSSILIPTCDKSCFITSFIIICIFICSPIGSKILIMKVVEISMMMMMSITVLAVAEVKVVALEQNIFCY